jgi:hypothetical protein
LIISQIKVACPAASVGGKRSPYAKRILIKSFTACASRTTLALKPFSVIFPEGFPPVDLGVLCQDLAVEEVTELVFSEAEEASTGVEVI